MEIPDHVRQDILLDDRSLERELHAMTDAYTDRIAAGAADQVSGPQPWSFVNGLSRLVVDPERFSDDTEEMNAVGMGAVYTRTSTGEPLRDDDRARRDELIRTLFDPYAVALADLVDARLTAVDRAVIIDIHSYPRDPLPYELRADVARPEVCLGVDPVHTPEWLLDAASDAFASGWSVGVNTPFRGTYVPLRHYGREDRVTSLMLEIRRDGYLRPDSSPDGDAIAHLASATAALIDGITLVRA